MSKYENRGRRKLKIRKDWCLRVALGRPHLMTLLVKLMKRLVGKLRERRGSGGDIVLLVLIS